MGSPSPGRGRRRGRFVVVAPVACALVSGAAAQARPADTVKPTRPVAAATCAPLTITHGEFGLIELERARGSLPIVSARLAAGVRKRVSVTRTVRCLVRVVHTTHAVVVRVAGNGGGTVASTPSGLTCSRTTTPCSKAFAEGTEVRLRATPAADSNFTGWSGACAGAGECVVTTDAARRVVATFTKKRFMLAVTKAGAGGGTVASSPSGIVCGAVCSALFEVGSRVTLTAEPDPKSEFGGWSGACSGTGACEVTIAAAATATATFVKKSFPLTVTKTGTGAGTVRAQPAGLDCGANCTVRYELDTLVTLSATPDATSFFTEWTGACAGAQATCTVPITAAKFVTAKFTRGVLVTVSVNGEMSGGLGGNGEGTVVSDPPGIVCDERGADAPGNTCSALFLPTTRVTLTPNADPDNSFLYWYRCDDPNNVGPIGLPCAHFAYELADFRPVAHFGPDPL